MTTRADIHFRSAHVGDVERLVQLWSAASLGADAHTDRAEITTRLATADDFFVVGVEASGEEGVEASGEEGVEGEEGEAGADGEELVVACAMGCYDGHRGHVKRVAVHPEHQGRGLGHAIMAEVERRFLAAGITKLRLQVWTANERGGAFWEANGWSELTEIRYFTKDLLGAPDDGC